MSEQLRDAADTSRLAYAYQVKILLAHSGLDLPEEEYPTVLEFVGRAQEAGMTPFRCSSLMAAALHAVDRSSSSSMPNVTCRNMALDRILNGWDQYVG